jgi:hypothetical protein
VVEIRDVPMINFSKCMRLHDCLQHVFRHRPPDVSIYRQSKTGVLAYLEKELRDISVSSTTDKRQDERSRLLKTEEESRRRLYYVGMK